MKMENKEDKHWEVFNRNIYRKVTTEILSENSEAFKWLSDKIGEDIDSKSFYKTDRAWDAKAVMILEVFFDFMPGTSFLEEPKFFSMRGAFQKPSLTDYKELDFQYNLKSIIRRLGLYERTSHEHLKVKILTQGGKAVGLDENGLADLDSSIEPFIFTEKGSELWNDDDFKEYLKFTLGFEDKEEEFEKILACKLTDAVILF